MHAAQLLLHLANNRQFFPPDWGMLRRSKARSSFSLNTARTQKNNYLCQECGGYRQGYGRIEVHSFLLKIRERTLAARSKVLEMLEVKDEGWFGRLDDDSQRVKWMRRVYLLVDYTQAP